MKKTAVLFLLVALSVAFSLAFGSQPLAIKDLFTAKETVSKTIFFNIRLPRTILAALSGMLLAGSGAVFQLFFRNSLAEPGIMGMTSGAALGAVTAGCMSTGIFAGFISSVNAGAFIGALIAGIIVIIISSNKKGPSSAVAVLLCGTALGTLYSSLTSIILTFNSKKISYMYLWMLGSFSGRGWNEVYVILLPSIISFVLMIALSFRLDLMGTGEITASSLGVQINILRAFVLVCGSFATSAAVCAGGTIGFIGLIVPHLIRRIFGVKSRLLIPLSLAGGVIMLLISDTLCRIIIAPGELPVGTVTALMGAPFFIFILFSSKGHKNG